VRLGYTCHLVHRYGGIIAGLVELGGISDICIQHSRNLGEGHGSLDGCQKLFCMVAGGGEMFSDEICRRHPLICVDVEEVLVDTVSHLVELGAVLRVY
jgi:hypothetical protein